MTTYQNPNARPGDYDHALTDFLDMAVPLEILEIKAAGGCTWEMVEIAQPILRTGADNLLYGGVKKGEIGAMVGRLAQAIAILSFVEGGVRMFGRHWESLPILGKESTL